MTETLRQAQGERYASVLTNSHDLHTMSEFHLAIGQYINYRLALHEHDPQRHLLLAIPLDTYETFFGVPFVQRVLQTNAVSLCVYSIQYEVITTWINLPPIENMSNNS